MKEDQKFSYISMFFGGVGTIFVLFAAIELYKISGSTTGYFIAFFGFLFTINYINYLESKAGVSKKVTWVRAILSIIVVFIVSYFLYF
ncbi:hypothetical protein V7147_07840 [Bacillus sp. JJ1521]|uniref:hypothetical protein n=1 Tax=Bacillus sp. JJ1521 TaxID=3122957 RepID=UPI002FFEB308